MRDTKGMIQVRQDFVREAALLLADLAGRADASSGTDTDGFLKALLETTAVDGRLGASATPDAPLDHGPFTPFLAQLKGSKPPLTPISDALAAYDQRLAFGTVLEGLDWPVDLKA